MPKKRTPNPSSQSRSRNPNGLTVLEQAVCDAYLADPDRCGARAYRKAKPEASVTVSRACAARMLARPHVAAYLKAREAERRKVAEAEFELNDRNTLAVLRDMAFFDPADAFTGHEPKPLDQMPLAVRRAIVGFDAQGRPRFANRGESVDRAMRHLGLFEKDNAQRRTAEEVEAGINRLLAELGA